jgi:FixJ family two-component response regulator
MKDLPIIAIVDDDASVRRALLRVVESAGYKAETFASAGDFLAWLPHGQAACLILDVHMDDVSGFDLHDRLKVPIVFITGHDDAATVTRIEKSRAAGHLRKPFDRATVLDTIRRAVGAPVKVGAVRADVAGDGHQTGDGHLGGDGHQVGHGHPDGDGHVAGEGRGP